MTRVIGKVSATEKSPSTCDDFAFWLTDDTILSPFDIVRVHNASDDSDTYGVVQDILHITDSPSHISNYVSSDFGDIYAEPMTRRLSLSLAKCSVIHNTKENFMPLIDGASVYHTNEEDIHVALGLDAIPEESSIPAGLLRTSQGVAVPIHYHGDFIIGPEGAHINVSGISGLATKTSYIMFLLKSIQHRLADSVSIIIMNVKGDDLLHIDQPNERISEAQRKEWEILNVPCEPFQRVSYFYPYGNKKDSFFANTAIAKKALERQVLSGTASNYVYTFEHDVGKLPMLFANVDDPNWTIGSILHEIEDGDSFRGIESWRDLKDALHDFAGKEREKASRAAKEIHIQSWKRFSRLINNSVNDSIFQNALSDSPERRQTHLSDAIQNIEGGQVYVVDIAGLNEQLQCLVFGDVIQSVYGLKHGDYDDHTRRTKKPVPKRIVIFVDELNKYAPTTVGKSSPLLADLLEITERGRSEQVILFSAEQFRSAVHERIKGNCGTNVYGRTNAIEISRPDYRFVPKVYANMMTRLQKGDLIVQHPIFKTLLRVTFPYPSYCQGGGKNG